MLKCPAKLKKTYYKSLINLKNVEKLKNILKHLEKFQNHHQNHCKTLKNPAK
jgi:hypothetical protein